ncbi:hypothetical protein HYT53_04195 [Candidatus Woesearchaeota archaeon]|nr:hypothetical protein [Candidatus Woesearchaeota archaeon]
MESGETAEAVEGKTVEDSDSGRHDSRHYEKAEQEDYQSEPVQSRYSKNARDSEDGRGSEKKSRSKKGLEKIVNSLKKEAGNSGIDETEYASAHFHENISEFLEESDDSEEEEFSYKDAVAFIYNKATGEFLLEEKPGTYYWKSERWKKALIGGKGNKKDYSTYATLKRELGEEIQKGAAKDTIIRTLESSGTLVERITDLWKGREIIDDIYKIHIEPVQEWHIAREAKSTHDAGPFHVLTYDQILSMPNSAFAFNHGQLLKKFILEEFVRNKPSSALAPYASYALPLFSTSPSHLKAIQDYSNPSLALRSNPLIPNQQNSFQKSNYSQPLYTQ